MKEINNGYFTGERSLFNSEDIKINNTIFGEGRITIERIDNIEHLIQQLPMEIPIMVLQRCSC